LEGKRRDSLNDYGKPPSRKCICGERHNLQQRKVHYSNLQVRVLKKLMGRIKLPKKGTLQFSIGVKKHKFLLVIDIYPNQNYDIASLYHDP
jgi:hypothetical protein